MPASIRSAPSTFDQYSAAPGGNLVEYLCADIWDERAWARLAGSRFNVVFSDGEHSPEAIYHEAKMLERYDLVSHDEFAIVWDDLGGPMTDAFIDTWISLRERFTLILVPSPWARARLAGSARGSPPRGGRGH